jgi:mannose-6-phosphate isomerase-like protein (cupin superfamily)
MDKDCWKPSLTRKEKEWGHEISWLSIPTLRGKIISMDKGKKTSIKSYRNKSEVFFVLEGTAEIVYAPDKWHSRPNHKLFVREVLSTGEVLVIQANCPYRIEAVTDIRIFEMANWPTDLFTKFNDDVLEPPQDETES